jgi:hypothetical protein
MRKTLFPSATRAIHRSGTTCCAAIVAASLALWCLPAYAHHSYAEFDMEVTRTLSGTLKEFNWVSPHTNLKVAYVNDQGVAQEIPISTGSPAVLSRQGFKAEDFVLGSRVTMSWHPNRSGASGGELAELTLQDGRVLKGHGAFPAIPGGGSFGPLPGGRPPGERAPNVPE